MYNNKELIYLWSFKFLKSTYNTFMMGFSDIFKVLAPHMINKIKQQRYYFVLLHLSVISLFKLKFTR
jgi:hypothetical protein